MNPKYEQLIKDILFEQEQIDAVVLKIKGLSKRDSDYFLPLERKIKIVAVPN